MKAERMSLRTESLHAFYTTNPPKNSWYRKFPRPQGAPRYWLTRDLTPLFNCIVAFSQGQSWLIKNLIIRRLRKLLANVFCHEAGAIVLEQVMFCAVSTAHITIHRTPFACQNYLGHGLVQTLVSSCSICFYS